MKKRIRKTGEIVDVITYCAPLNEIRADGDWVSYIDSDGFEHHYCDGLNIYWDFEDVGEGLTKKIDWEEVRIKAAIGVLNAAISANWFSYIKDYESQAKELSANAVLIADALIDELKKGGSK